MDDLKLMPLYNPQAILTGFGKISEDLIKVFDKTDSREADLTTVMNNALAGNVLLWLVFWKKQYVGFFVVRIVVTGTEPQHKHLWIEQGYRKSSVGRESDRDLVGEAIQYIENWANAQGCTEAHIQSSRKGYERFIDKYGYRPTVVEYVKEI